MNRRLNPQDVVCAVCNAVPGMPCTRVRGGLPMKGYHNWRVDAADEPEIDWVAASAEIEFKS